MKDFAGRVAAISGACSGLGRALALELAARQCHLALSSNVDPAGLAETAALAARHGVRVTTQPVDMATREQVQAWAAQVAQDHGQVSLVVNNAAMAPAEVGCDLACADYEWAMNLNFWGVIYGIQAFLPALVAAGGGHIVTVSSQFGLFAPPGMGAYHASRFAVRGFPESLHQELDLEKNGVGATCVHPGAGAVGGIAAAGVSPNIQIVTGATAEETRRNFMRLFGITPEAAAREILEGVQHNARRVLIGADTPPSEGRLRLLPSLYHSLLNTGLKLVRKAA